MFKRYKKTQWRGPVGHLSFRGRTLVFKTGKILFRKLTHFFSLWSLFVFFLSFHSWIFPSLILLLNLFLLLLKCHAWHCKVLINKREITSFLSLHSKICIPLSWALYRVIHTITCMYGVVPESAWKSPNPSSSSSRCVVCVFRVEDMGNSCSWFVSCSPLT